jgi:hypothetical protein
MPTTFGISNLSPVPTVFGRLAYALSRSLLYSPLKVAFRVKMGSPVFVGSSLRKKMLI